MANDIGPYLHIDPPGASDAQLDKLLNRVRLEVRKRHLRPEKTPRSRRQVRISNPFCSEAGSSRQNRALRRFPAATERTRMTRARISSKASRCRH